MGRDRSAHGRSEKGRSRTKRHWGPEVLSQSTSGSDSDITWSDRTESRSDSESDSQSGKAQAGEYKNPMSSPWTKINKIQKTPLTDWKKIQIACVDWASPTTLAFPVRVSDGGQRTYSPMNPKDIQAIVKANADKGINSAMVSTLIDSVFGNDNMLPLDIKQTCRLIFDGAEMIVFKQECEDQCAKQLAQVTGADHALHGSSLQRLMGTDPTMITPQAQAQNLQGGEVAATTRAAREAIRVACGVVAKPAPWSTIKQNESESFTQFVDWLQAAVDSSALPPEAKGPVVAECFRQQCNLATKEILWPLPAGSSIAAMIKHVAKEEHIAPIQAAVRTAIANVMACFKCSQMGHNASNCPQPDRSLSPFPSSGGPPRGPCWACGRRGHLAKDCRAKVQGNRKGRGRLGCMQPPPTWDVRRPSYANPKWGGELPNPLPPREVTNFMAQLTTQSDTTTPSMQQGPPLENETLRWPWQ
ncbi:hypothetical protein HGM15179_020147 [Zosterops borbonicus]|uniref:CCHC-type domain-containing protein n=1 Tax=Zosterops borbonicus TaxID=364589 RepID=A0A8K1DAN7_9PASS|nr:hypothetical protein HGM15179_020147 [Zosterops borbonicus]